MNALQLRQIQLNSRHLRDQIVSQPYAWPGGYPLFAVTSDGGCLCSKCCKTEAKQIGSTCGNDGWQIVAIDVNWEDENLPCDHCGELIESAYGEPKESSQDGSEFDEEFWRDYLAH
jgi:hypothetical protein